MGKFWGFIVLVSWMGGFAWSDAITTPKSFTDPMLKKLQSDIITDDKDSTADTYVLKVYAMFEKSGAEVSANDFVALLTDHKNYEKLFKGDVDKGVTISVSPDKNDYKYSLWVKSNGLPVRINGEQKITRPQGTAVETVIKNKISSFKNFFSSIEEVSTVYPYGKALLVEDILVMKKVSSNGAADEVQKKLGENLPRFIKKFREELTK